MKRISLLAFSALLLISSCNRKNNPEVISLRTDSSENPMGIDNPSPRFSWKISDSTRNVIQEAFKITVATDPKILDSGNTDMWNSGWIKSGQSLYVKYRGKELDPRTRYFWKVRIRDNHRRESESTEEAFFETGIMDQSKWNAQWIGFIPGKDAGGSIDSNQRPRSVMLRKEFSIESAIESARIYISGLGSYVLYINGHRTGNDHFTPGWTDYNVRVHYQTYDISEQLKKGENAIGIILGNMWWSGGLGWGKGEVYSKGPLRAIARMDIKFTNGGKKTILTDNSWKGYVSPVIQNSIYHGEMRDARMEIPMWSEPGLEDSKWGETMTLDMNEIKITAQSSPTVKVMDTIIPVSVKEIKPGIFVYDMGINMVGKTILRANGKNGDTISLKFAELLHDDGTVAQENLRSARATDRYICKGTGEEVWQPHFTYHGFRYVQVEGYRGRPDNNTVTGLQLYSSAETAGTFLSSNEMLNSIWNNLLRGQKGNMYSVPTDCPQRDERLGWMGDAQIFSPTACYNMNMAGFFTKWLRDIRDSQHESGYVYDVNPAIVVGGPSKAGWGDAITVIPRVLYDFYGDTAILNENYPGMKAWVEYMRKKSNNHIYRWRDTEEGFEGYGDWIAVVESPVEPISAAYYYYSTRLLSETAGIIDKRHDQEKYSAIADSIRQAFNDKFFDKENINYPGNTQTANLLPLVFGLVPDKYREQIAQNIINDVNNRGKHPSTGFLGTAYLLPVLSDYGQHQLAYETAVNEDYPSWGYMVRKGATTMWELWNSDKEPPEGMNSRNHFALGSVVQWYYSHLAGIRPLEPGFKKIQIKPYPPDGLEWIECSYESAYGKIESSWHKGEEEFRQQMSIPPNTTAEVYLPVIHGNFSRLEESGKVILQDGIENSEDETVKLISVDKEYIVLKLNSGRYDFALFR